MQTIAQNPNTTLDQIGRMTVLAISGGRVNIRYNGTVADEVTEIVLPVRYGYAVRITLNANDTYTVERTFTRSNTTTVKAAWDNVYADEISDVAYAASCYHN